jgi:hypothetical protein
MIKDKAIRLLKNTVKISGAVARIAVGIGSAALLLFSFKKTKKK